MVKSNQEVRWELDSRGLKQWRQQETSQGKSITEEWGALSCLPLCESPDCLGERSSEDTREAGIAEQKDGTWLSSQPRLGHEQEDRTISTKELCDLGGQR